MSHKYFLFGVLNFFIVMNCCALPEGDKWRKTVFSHIHQTNHWGNGESLSGPGSSIASTKVIRGLLPSILRILNINVLLDAGCGDLNWLHELHLPLKTYIGIDIVANLIEKNRKIYGNDTRFFFCLDVVKDPLPCVDAILCRDCLAHLSYQDITDAIKNFKETGSTYLLATDFPQMQKNDAAIKTGDFRPVNLRVAPYNFPEPLMSFVELSAEGKMKRWGKRLSVWRLDGITVDEDVF